MESYFRGMLYLGTQSLAELETTEVVRLRNVRSYLVAELKADDVVSLKRNARNAITNYFDNVLLAYFGKTVSVKYSAWVKLDHKRTVYITSAWIEDVKGVKGYTSQFRLCVVAKTK